MKYVALLSGGKDSCFNLLHCARNGHELVAAASLGPELGKEELDSYLYQTVGQDAIQFVAQALEVPLYRRIISGSAVEKGSQYGNRTANDMGVQGDETEDLHELLSNVKLHHPEIQGVSVGAILSNYQRVRVEHVCRRLSLIPLCYLWQRDQSELLSEMIEAGMEAILIKVAGIGLTEQHLGKTLTDMQPTLLKLNDLYGSHVCGEGGEYETLTLDCPLFKHRIKLAEVDTVFHSDNDLAPVAFLRIKTATLCSKSNVPPPDTRIPPILAPDSLGVRDSVIRSQRSIKYLRDDLHHQLDEPCSDHISSKKLGTWIAIANVQRPPDAEGISVEAETHACFHALKEALSTYSLSLAHCSHINVFLSSMDLFHPVNAVYMTYFGVCPPSRACVAVDLPPPVRIKLDCIAYAEVDPNERQCLHVQGLSYWAPANIGPYSQAIMADERIFISGQIGLIPSSLTLPSPSSLAIETALSFQHVKRVVAALRNYSGPSWSGHSQLVLYWLVNDNDLPHVKQACAEHEKHIAPVLFLVVKALPKDALLEKQAVLHTGRCLIPDSDDEPSMQLRVPTFHQGESSKDELLIHWEISEFKDSGASYAIVCFRGEGNGNLNLPRLEATFGKSGSRILSIRLFYKSPRKHLLASAIEGLFGQGTHLPITSIPCKSISTMNYDNWDYAICILGN